MTTLNTPLGTPASSDKYAIAVAEKGVSGAGFATTLQPTAIAGAIFLANIAEGKFHGVMHPTTPIGCLITNVLRSY